MRQCAERAISSPITLPGDRWLLGAHPLICGDARQKEALTKLLEGDEVDIIYYRSTPSAACC
jgi:hypothetical protein